MGSCLRWAFLRLRNSIVIDCNSRKLRYSDNGNQDPVEEKECFRMVIQTLLANRKSEENQAIKNKEETNMTI